MVGPRPLDTEGVLGLFARANLFLFPRDPRWGNLGEPPTPTTVHTIRHPTRNRNDPIARAELYQLSYIPRAKWSMHEGVRCFFYSFPWRSWAILDLNQRPRP
ncbi:hypothetical protein ES288_A06G139400v1 [Gossypium darwinii]|uniref:Uncharacterized protein n=1 Tax=Gossypium darwinii TaxID=34276 RepID=A0A5D2G5D8_GOSDA|nr:hypothetical protein ES288_A06G139400v1 [Gossypium darwinii]